MRSGAKDSKQETNEGRKFQQNFESRQDSPQYKKYLAQRKALPIFVRRDEILQTLNENQVLIISGNNSSHVLFFFLHNFVLCLFFWIGRTKFISTGETGSGKSTQVPQFIVEEWLKCGKGDKCNVVCTEPRRISAISLALRVSLEMGDGEKKIGTVGSLCGYQVCIFHSFLLRSIVSYSLDPN